MHSGNRCLHRAQNVAVIKRGQSAGQAALDADFGGPDFPSLYGLFSDLLRIEEVSIGLAGAAAEGAEFASDKTDVGEIDVPVDHVGDNVAGQFAAQ